MKVVTLKIYQSFRRKALLSGQSAWLVNYAERHRAGLRRPCADRRDGQFPGEPPDE
jgi:hypothetical protein